MYCSQCGTAAAEDASVCAQCGFQFSSVSRPRLNAERVGAASRDAWRAVKLLLRDPVGSMGAAYEALTPQQGLDVGIAFCAVFMLSSLIAMRLIANVAQRLSSSFLSFSFGIKEVFTTLLVAAVPVISIMAIFALLQRLANRERDLRRAVFAGGASVIPLAVFNLFAGVLGAANAEVLAIVAVFALCYTILLIYAGCRDVLHVSSTVSAPAVPVVVLATAWLTKIILVAVM
jgi:hypothetical protein